MRLEWGSKGYFGLFGGGAGRGGRQESMAMAWRLWGGRGGHRPCPAAVSDAEAQGLFAAGPGHADSESRCKIMKDFNGISMDFNGFQWK